MHSALGPDESLVAWVRLSLVCCLLTSLLLWCAQALGGRAVPRALVLHAAEPLQGARVPPPDAGARAVRWAGPAARHGRAVLHAVSTSTARHDDQSRSMNRYRLYERCEVLRSVPRASPPLQATAWTSCSTVTCTRTSAPTRWGCVARCGIKGMARHGMAHVLTNTCDLNRVLLLHLLPASPEGVQL